MRTLDECRAEIFRLGEIKIKRKNKNRKMLLSIFVPFIACVIIVGGAILPKMLLPTDSGDYSAPENSGVGALYTMCVEVRLGEDIVYTKTDEAEVSSIYELLCQSYASSSTDGSSVQPEISGGASPQTSYYEINFTFENGEIIKYTLKENTLTNKNTGESVRLSKESLDNIKSALELE